MKNLRKKAASTYLFATVGLLTSLPLNLFAEGYAPVISTPSAAASTSGGVRRITQKIDRTKLSEMKGHVRPFLSQATDQGQVSGSEKLGSVMLMLSRTQKQQADLDAYVDQVHNKNSASFHKWLTPQEFGARYQPVDEDVQAVKEWLQGEGFTIQDVSPSKTYISFTGTVGQLRNTFHADIHHVTMNGESHMATVSEPQIPAALASVIGGLHKLDDFSPKPLSHMAGLYKRDKATGKTTRVAESSAPYAPSFTTPIPTADGGGTSYNVGPQDFYTIYNENPLLQAGITGAGQTIALIEEVQVAAADVNTFRSQFGLPAYPATPNATAGGVNYMYGTTTGLGGYASCVAPATQAAGKSSGEESEADLDLQWAGVVAPNATIDFVACGGGASLGTTGIDRSAQYVANYLAGTVVAASMSYGACEAAMTSSQVSYYNAQWEQFAAEGITPIVSSGDAGAEGCYQNKTFATTQPPSVNGLGSSNYNVSAGGTDLGDLYESNNYTTTPVGTFWNATNGTGYSSATGYIPETTWAGYCSNQLFASYLQAAGSTTFGSTYTPSAICSNATAKTDGLLAVVGASGGISTYSTIPTWQSVYGVGANSVSTTYRNLPDISLYASNGFWGHALPFCESDVYTCDYSNSTDAYELGAGGTSFVAPQLAGLMALIAQKTGQRQGQANYTFYNLAAQQYGTTGKAASTLASCSGSAAIPGQRPPASCYFYDVSNDMPSLQAGTITPGIYQPCQATRANCYQGLGTTYGVNVVPGTTATAGILGYTASPGYDDATGLGSLNINGIVQGWNNASPSFASTTAISSSASTVTYSGSDTLTATVVATGRGATVAPAGIVDFYLGSTTGTKLGSGTITSVCTGTNSTTSCTGSAALSVTGSSLPSGSNSIVAYFEGDGANDAPSTSSPTTVTAYVQAPVGSLDKAVDTNTVQPTISQNGTIYISGWAADLVDGSPLVNVKVSIDSTSIGTPILNQPRPDIASYTGVATYANSGFYMTYSASGLATGTHSVSVTATDSAGLVTTFAPKTITVTGVYSNPTGGLDVVADAATNSTTVPQSDGLNIIGWAGDPLDGSVANIVVYVDGVSIGAPTKGVSRPDVVSATGNNAYANSGFTLTYNTSLLSIGTHAVSVTATNAHGLSTTFGPKAITVVAGNRAPVGALDQAVDSLHGTTTVSKSNYLYVSGWAADYQDNSGAQSVSVLIDGVAIGNATLGQPRPDVQSANPSQNWTNSGYVYVYPSTSTLSIGTHSVTTVATDSLGIKSTFGPITITVIQ